MPKMITINCDYCGKEIEKQLKKVTFARKNNNKMVCSVDCSNALLSQLNNKKIAVNCNYCSIEFKKSRTKINEINNYCSTECFVEWQKENLSLDNSKLYGNSINSYRKLAFKYYGKTCNRCNYDVYEQMLDVHHIDRNRKNNAVENLEVLCVWCHYMETHKVTEQTWNGSYSE